jgi:hypothetical protein
VARGLFRTDIAPEGITLLVTHTLMATVEMSVLGSNLTGSDVSADDLWAFCSGGILSSR